jgi:hypothetical protein
LDWSQKLKVNGGQGKENGKKGREMDWENGVGKVVWGENVLYKGEWVEYAN